MGVRPDLTMKGPTKSWEPWLLLRLVSTLRMSCISNDANAKRNRSTRDFSQTQGPEYRPSIYSSKALVCKGTHSWTPNVQKQPHHNKKMLPKLAASMSVKLIQDRQVCPQEAFYQEPQACTTLAAPKGQSTQLKGVSTPKMSRSYHRDPKYPLFWNSGPFGCDSFDSDDALIRISDGFCFDSLEGSEALGCPKEGLLVCLGMSWFFGFLSHK